MVSVSCIYLVKILYCFLETRNELALIKSIYDKKYLRHIEWLKYFKRHFTLLQKQILIVNSIVCLFKVDAWDLISKQSCFKSFIEEDFWLVNTNVRVSESCLWNVILPHRNRSWKMMVCHQGGQRAWTSSWKRSLHLVFYSCLLMKLVTQHGGRIWHETSCHCNLVKRLWKSS